MTRDDLMSEHEHVLRAKALVEELKPGGIGNRKWLKSDPVRPYGSKHDSAVLHILEGTPPRAYLVENGHDVVVLDGALNPLCRVVSHAGGSIEVVMVRSSWWWVERFQGYWRAGDDEELGDE